MSNVLVERDFDPPLTVEQVETMAAASISCMDLYQVNWQRSFLAADGTHLLCHFLAPDLEAVRVLLRQTDSPPYRAWSGSLHQAPEDEMEKEINVVVERHFEEAASFDDLQALEDTAADCLNLHRVQFVRTYFSTDKKRMICLYHAPDAESVRIAQHQAGMPVTKVWACRELKP